MREACVVRGGYHLNSDHWPIDGSLLLERKELWCKSRLVLATWMGTEN